jgi:hypothetical protein
MTEEDAARPKRAPRTTTTTAATISAAHRAKPPAPKRPVAVPVIVESRPADESRLTIQQGGVGTLTATDVTITQGGVGAVRTERLSIELGGVGAAMTDQLDVRQGIVGAVIARDAHFEQAGVRNLIANRVHFGPNSGAGVVLAARVDGDVRTLLDWRGAIAFGVAAGVVMALFRGRRR